VTNHRRRRRRVAICPQRQFDLQGSCTKRKIFQIICRSPNTRLTGAMFVVALLP